jgi:DNA-binding MarR family transcriptional regulator
LFHAAHPASGIIGKSREFMNTDINLRILDRFRHVGRMLRVADNPCSGSLRDPGFAEPVPDPEQASGRKELHPVKGVLKRDVVLPFLLCSRDGMKQKEIADEIRVSPSTLSEMIDRLVEDGFVERKPDSEDRRVKRLCLTESGRDRAEYMLKQLTAILERMFINLDTGEKEELIRLLDKLTGFDSRVAGFEKE